MSSSIQYRPVNGDHNDHYQETQSQNELPDEWHAVTESTRSGHSRSSPSISEPDTILQEPPVKSELPQEFRTSKYLENASISRAKPPWHDPVRWCMWGNIAVLAINIIFTIAAVGVSASKYGDKGFGSVAIYQGNCKTAQHSKIGFHLLINILSVTMTATSSYCCTILMAPSRSEVDNAHAKGTWLSIGVASWRNFRNMKRSRQILWGLLLLTSMIMQIVYNSVVYSSVSANTYPVIVAPLDFVSNASVPTSYYETQNCFPEDLLTWNVTDLRKDILNGTFEYLNKEDCLNAYATSYLSDRRSLVLVTDEPLTGDGILLAGYGYPGGMPAMDPSKNMSQDYFSIKDSQSKLQHHLGYDWMCYAHSSNSGGVSSCSSNYIQGLGYWNVTADELARITYVKIQDNPINITVDKLATIGPFKSQLERQLNSSDIDWTKSQRDDFLSYVKTSPQPEQMRAYLDHTSWAKSVKGGIDVQGSCPQPGDESSNGHEVIVDHCLSQKASEACGLFYQIPIAFTIIICGLIKIICMWLLLRTDRFELLLTMGDAISSFLQRSDPTTKNWCTLSSDTVLTNKACPWGAKNQTFEEKGFLPQEPHPDILRTMQKTSNMTPSGHALPPTLKRWLQGTSNRIWGMSWFALIIYIIISLLFPTLAVKRELGDEYQDGQPLNEIWQIKGWGAVQSTALLTSYVTSFVGSILTSNMLQLVASFLYYCLNDHLTRCLIAADYNSFAVNRAPLRVSFPQGEQRSTFYLTIPYEYAIPLLVGFTLIHWFVSEGLFYVQVMPYDLYASAVPSELLITCGVSTIPLIVGLLLAVVIFLVISSICSRSFKDSKMPLALGMSVVVSAACHAPYDDPDAAYKPVQWGVVANGPDDSFLHCTFTSQEVKEPEEGVQYA